jgi:TIR domain-containing protein/PASTA domain-containing protein
MPVIFISYRRDSGGHAGRLFDRLREHFGRDRVFLDVAGINVGSDFVETIDKAVGSCDVLLAVIGREWLTCCDKQGRRRLDDPNDFIRAEIAAALKRDVRVVPVLVEGAEMPPTDELPEELKRLTRRQAVELRDSRWDADVEALLAALAEEATQTLKGLPPRRAPQPEQPPHLGDRRRDDRLARQRHDRAEPAEPAGPEEGRKPGRRALLWAIGAAVTVLIAVGVALSVWPDEPVDQVDQEVELPQVSEPVTTAAGEPVATPAGEPMVSVPDLVGLSLKEALNRLRVSGLAIGHQEAKQTADAPARRVLSQRPRPGTQLDPGAPVDLVYAEPLPDTRIEVPDVVGADIWQATETLLSAGFEIARQKEPSAEAWNKVLRQEPAAGSRVEKRTQVTLVYAPGTTVSIHYAAEADRGTAEGLASYLRGLGLQGTDYSVLLSNRRLATGKLFYASKEQADLAKTIADRSGSWLSQTYHRRVRVKAKLDPDVARTELIITISGSR